MRSGVRASVRGTVQGVGFRPFAARLATQLGLAGEVRNGLAGVEIEVEGIAACVAEFRRRLVAEAPAAARIDDIAWSPVTPRDRVGFVIAPSDAAGRVEPSCAADLALCEACAAEIRDPGDRRWAYPFTTCTACGPRFTVIEALPWDRARTSMASFELCSACRAEYHDPSHRRFHAEPIACADCGPSLRLQSADGAVLARRQGAVEAAARALQSEAIVAVLGLGGFQLLVDATSDRAVRRLRDRKARPRKPFAVMFPDLAGLAAVAEVDAQERAALGGPAGPIVLVRWRGTGVSAQVAPGLHRLGAMLPTTPLHALLLDRFGGPVVATSGNLQQDPICTDVVDGCQVLGGIADAFLVHDRPVLHPCDDSVVQVVAGRVRVLRAARGFRPSSFALPLSTRPILACGGHLKVAPALAVGDRILAWPHVGDLDSPAARAGFAAAVQSLEQLVGVVPERIVVDAHPDYASWAWARTRGLPIDVVHHHHAHIAATLAEHGARRALGFAWDGVGLGVDNGAWGGETLQVSPAGARRVAWLRPFALPGADAAARDGRRALAGLLEGAGLTLPGEHQALTRLRALARIPSLAPVTTSMGRLFDAVAALVGLADRSSYEGEAAILLEQIAGQDLPPYPFGRVGRQLDWAPMLAKMIEERDEPERVASRFHATLARLVADVARDAGATSVALGGGCFQNARLLGLVEAGLEAASMGVLAPCGIPAGDGGLAVGQAWVAAGRLANPSGSAPGAIFPAPDPGS